MTRPLVASAAVLIFSSILAPGAIAGSMGLAWDPSAGADSYTVHYGPQPGDYSVSVPVGSASSVCDGGECRATIDRPDLEDCTTWYVAVTAHNAAGPSAFSEEISGWPRPVVTQVDPGSAIQGSRFTLEVEGVNFQAGAGVELDNPHVFLDEARALSCDRIQASATVEPTAEGVRPAEVGPWNVAVVNPDGVYGERPEAFEVLIAEERFDVDDEGPSRSRLDGMDVIRVSRLFGSQEGAPSYEPDSDLDGDGWIDGNELAFISANLGRCWDGNDWTVEACEEQGLQ